MLPFVRLLHGSLSTYCWWILVGLRRMLPGRPPRRRLRARGPSRCRAFRLRTSRCPSEERFLHGFLDDLYVVTMPSSASRPRRHSARSRRPVWSAPPGIAELDDDVWRGDKPDAQQGVIVLGSPLGHLAFVRAWADERLRAEQEIAVILAMFGLRASMGSSLSVAQWGGGTSVGYEGHACWWVTCAYSSAQHMHVVFDAAGCAHTMSQGESGEPGDCPHFMRWRNMKPRASPKANSRMARLCSPSSTIRASSLRPSVSARFTKLWHLCCGTGHAPPVKRPPRPDITDPGEGGGSLWVGDWRPWSMMRSPRTSSSAHATTRTVLERSQKNILEIIPAAPPAGGVAPAALLCRPARKQHVKVMGR